MGKDVVDAGLAVLECEDGGARWWVVALDELPSHNANGKAHLVTAIQAQSLIDDAGTGSWVTTASGIVSFWGNMSDDAKDALEAQCEGQQ